MDLFPTLLHRLHNRDRQQHHARILQCETVDLDHAPLLPLFTTMFGLIASLDDKTDAAALEHQGIIDPNLVPDLAHLTAKTKLLTFETTTSMHNIEFKLRI